MKQKTILWTLIGILIIMTILLIYSIQKNLTAGLIKTKETLHLGAVLPLTGELASFGEDSRNGIELAVGKVNKEKPFKINIIYEDTKTDAQTTLSAVKKLIEVDGVKIIIGPIKSSNVLAVAPITEKNKVILFTPVSASDDITYAGDYVFRNRESAKFNGEKMAEFLVSKGIDKVAVFGAQSSNSISYKKAFLTKFQELGKKVVFSADYAPDNLDFKTDITKAKNKGAEAIYIAAATGVDGGILVKQTRELSFGGVISGSTAFESEEFLNGAGSAAEGAFLTSPAFDIENPDVQDYRIKYKNLYGKESSAFAANAYDAIHIIANAIEYCGSDRGTDCIRDFLYNTKDYPGISGRTTFDKNGDVIKPVMIKIVKNKEFIPYEIKLN